MKDKFIKIRISEKEQKVLYKQINKSEYVRNLILNNRPTNYTLLIELGLFWEELKQNKTDKKLLDKLKKIILSIEDDN